MPFISNDVVRDGTSPSRRFIDTLDTAIDGLLEKKDLRSSGPQSLPRQKDRSKLLILCAHDPVSDPPYRLVVFQFRGFLRV